MRDLRADDFILTARGYMKPSDLSGAVAPTPTRVKLALPAGHAVVDVCASLDHSVLLSSCGDVWMCGLGTHGRLGFSTEETRVLPARIGRC